MNCYRKGTFKKKENMFDLTYLIRICHVTTKALFK